MAISEEATNSADVPLATHPGTEPDVSSVLTRGQALQCEQFCKDLRPCKADIRLEPCARKRDDLLAQDDNLQILFVVYEHHVCQLCEVLTVEREQEKSKETAT